MACIYPYLRSDMKAVGLTATRLSRIMGVPYGIVASRLRGERKLLLEEAIAIKRAVRSERPLEQLFQLTVDIDDINRDKLCDWLSGNQRHISKEELMQTKVPTA